MTISIDEAILLLQRAKDIIGGDKALVACRIGSGLEDLNVTDIQVIQDGESQYVEIQSAVDENGETAATEYNLDDFSRDYPDSTGEAIPEGIYYSAEADNFFGMTTQWGMGTPFYTKWVSRANEFPTS